MRSLGINVRKGKSGSTRGIYTARIGARGGFGRVVGTRKSGKKAGKPIMKDPRHYAHLVELGTSHSEAKPFIRPAIDSAKGQIVPAMAKGYERGLSRAVSKLKTK